MGVTSTQKERMLLSSAVVILEMIALVLQCAMARSPLSILSCCHGHQLPEVATIHGPNGQGTPIISMCRDETYSFFRIFRTDYGHTEVAAHFGNGKSNLCDQQLDLIFFHRPQGILYFDQGFRP